MIGEVRGELLRLIGRRALAPGFEIGISGDPSCLINDRSDILNSFVVLALFCEFDCEADSIKWRGGNY